MLQLGDFLSCVVHVHECDRGAMCDYLCDDLDVPKGPRGCEDTP